MEQLDEKSSIEIWKPVIGYEGLYDVSNLGRIRSLNYRRTGKTFILKPVLCSGYYVVNLWKNKKRSLFKLHRLIAQVFVPNPDNLPEVDHISTIKTDNRAINIRWTDRKGNVNNPITKERIKKAVSINGKMCSKPVIQCTLDGKEIVFWHSMSEAKKLGFNEGNISECCQGKRKTHKGFVWKFA